MFKREDITETRTVVVGTKIVPDFKIAEEIGQMLYIKDNSLGVVECNFCADNDFAFGPSSSMSTVMVNAFRHFAEWHPKQISELVQDS